ncbi:tripartite motif-containing protein 2-like isoform X2 [Pomacea canaliculata]|nr:tripartite motif-containing protein 2-like isoform X2 [Pomacea canaliculata]
MYVFKRLISPSCSSVKSEIDQGKLLRKFGRRGKGKGSFEMPCGVAVTKSGDIVVADTENHRIQIFSPDGAFKLKFGRKGPNPDQLNYPLGVAMTAEDHVAVTDSVNAAVKVFSREGELISCFTHAGLIEFPYGVAITLDNFFVFTDICKHAVIVLTPSGSVSHTFGSYGDERKNFDHPYFVAVNKSKQIIVSDAGNSAIKIFQFEGRLLRMFTLSDFKLPAEGYISLYGLCTDSDGNTLVVCNSTICIVTKNGRLWEVVTSKDGLTSPKGVAFSTAGRLVVTQSSFEDKHEVCVYRYNTEDYKSLNTLVYYAISI